MHITLIISYILRMHKTNIQKIAFSAQGKDVKSLLDPRFGRCSGLVLVDLTTMESQWIPNEQNLRAAQGAGIQTAQNIIAAGAQALISGHCGPKAFQVLEAANIPIFLSETLPIEQIVSLFKADKLTRLSSPDVEGHWA